MARSGINKVILLGNLGADPEVRTTAGGDAVATISIATSDSWKDKNTGEEQQKTEWHRVVFFRRMAEVVGQYLKGNFKLVAMKIKILEKRNTQLKSLREICKCLEVKIILSLNQTSQINLLISHLVSLQIWSKVHRDSMMKFLFKSL